MTVLDYLKEIEPKYFCEVCGEELNSVIEKKFGLCGYCRFRQKNGRV